jgi:DNA polymerase-3 subunit epsilon
VIGKLAIVDTETTGITPESACVEVACILYSVQHAAAIRSFASLIRADSNPAYDINAIPEELLREAPEPPPVWSRIREMVGKADVLVAHNAAFDKRYIPSDVQQGKPWLCTMTDLDWPCKTSSKSLVSVALAHGLGVSHAHRAMVDCDLISRLLTNVAERWSDGGADLAIWLEQGMKPKITVRALVSYEEREKAKSCGFSWDSQSKNWTKRIPESDVDLFPFKVARI